MTNYRRAKISGGTYFFTTSLADRKRTTLVDHIGLLKQIVREEMNVHPFEVNAMVVLPERWARGEANDVDAVEVA